MALGKKKINTKSVEIVKDIAAQGAREVLSFFLQDKSVKRAYVKVLLEMNMTHAEIQAITPISDGEIREIATGRMPNIDDALVETIRNMEINKLYTISGRILQRLDSPEVIEGMKGGDLAYSYKILLESRRLLENKSTANISVLINTLNKRFSEEGEKINNMLKNIEKKGENAQL